MKLLFDQNLSYRLLRMLGEQFPDSQHVGAVGLKEASDLEVWHYAASQGFAIVTKDADFHQRSFLYGHPPKIIWIRIGNCSTAEIDALLRRRHTEIELFGADSESAFLTIE